jgi:hypothetical protein
MSEMAKPLSLPELAGRINSLAKNTDDARLAFCYAMAEAKRRVPLETNMTFAQWGAEYLRKPNGEPYSRWTLYSYANFGEHPERLTQSRKKSSAHSSFRYAATAALRALRRANIPDQVNALMTAWEAASEDARSQFLHMINAQIQARKPIRADQHLDRAHETLTRRSTSGSPRSAPKPR